MSFADRMHFSRKSDPTYKQKKTKDNPPIEDFDSISKAKRRGGSLARVEFNRQNSLNSSARENQLKRTSILDTQKSEISGHTGGSKLMTIIKSSLTLNKSKSKSKTMLNDNRQSFYSDVQPSKSEESLNSVLHDSVHHIRASNLHFSDSDQFLYVDLYNSNKEHTVKSLVELTDECTVQPVHPSLVNGSQFCFQIYKRSTVPDVYREFSRISVTNSLNNPSIIGKSCSFNSSLANEGCASDDINSVYVINCANAAQRNDWMMKIKQHIFPDFENRARQENLLKVIIQEAKNLIPKKKYFCEVRLDNILYGRTTTKSMNETVFWGEEFEFCGLQQAKSMSVSLYKVNDTKRKREKYEPVAQINLPCSEFLNNSFVEKWYSPSPDIRMSSSNLRYSQSISTKSLNPSKMESEESSRKVVDSTPMIRIKARFRPLEIAPINFYQNLLDFLIKESLTLVKSLESHLKVKTKEEFINTLLLILIVNNKHVDFLTDLVAEEVTKSDDNLILRGNSMASKAMECYLKIIGGKYLSWVLNDLIRKVTTEEMDCEVDPLRFQNLKDQQAIGSNQKKLLQLVESVWSKICNSVGLLPMDLRIVFSAICDKLQKMKRNSCDIQTLEQVISSCLFLRFICPAIMSPFLFGLTEQYSDTDCVNRTFTLVAKCIQSLANFSQIHHGKEGYMKFMQDFLMKNFSLMRSFLKRISTESSQQKRNSDFYNSQSCYELSESAKYPLIDCGYQLAELTFQLTVHLREIPEKEYTPSLVKVRSLIENMSRSFSNISFDDFTKLKSDVVETKLHPSLIPILKVNKSNNNKTPGSSVVDTCWNPNIPQPIYNKNSSDDVNNNEENFSYIPMRNSRRTGCLEIVSSDSYVDFECSRNAIYGDQKNDNSQKYLPKEKYLNESQINNEWKAVVEESERPKVVTDPDFLTFSSGYQSLSTPLDNNANIDNRFKCSAYPDYINEFDPYYISQNNQNYMKLQPQRQANIFKKIRRNTPTLNSSTGSPNEDKFLVKTYSNSKLNAIDNSRETLSSMENLMKPESPTLSGSRSIGCLYQKRNASNNNSMSVCTQSHESLDQSLPTNIRLSRRNSQSMSANIITNVDLDPLISLELQRLKYLLQLNDIADSVKGNHLYHGSAVEQYRKRTRDEECIKSMMKESTISISDITEYLLTAYRLLKNIHHEGNMSVDMIVNYIMQINRRIQSQMQSGCNDYHSSTKPVNINTSSSFHKPHRDSSNFSSHSVPQSLFDYSSKVQNHENYTVPVNPSSIVKSLTMHDMIDRY